MIRYGHGAGGMHLTRLRWTKTARTTPKKRISPQTSERDRIASLEHNLESQQMQLMNCQQGEEEELLRKKINRSKRRIAAAQLRLSKLTKKKKRAKVQPKQAIPAQQSKPPKKKKRPSNIAQIQDRITIALVENPEDTAVHVLEPQIENIPPAFQPFVGCSLGEIIECRGNEWKLTKIEKA